MGFAVLPGPKPPRADFDREAGESARRARLYANWLAGFPGRGSRP